MKETTDNQMRSPAQWWPLWKANNIIILYPCMKLVVKLLGLNALRDVTAENIVHFFKLQVQSQNMRLN